LQAAPFSLLCMEAHSTRRSLQHACTINKLKAQPYLGVLNFNREWDKDKVAGGQELQMVDLRTCTVWTARAGTQSCGSVQTLLALFLLVVLLHSSLAEVPQSFSQCD
jgi:hypothetical protein